MVSIAEEKLAAAKPALAEAEAALQVRKIWNWTLMPTTVSIHYWSCMWHNHTVLSTHHPCRLSKLLTSPQSANWGNPHTSSCASWTVPCCCSRGSWIPLPWPRPTRSQAFMGRVTQGRGRGIHTYILSYFCNYSWQLKKYWNSTSTNLQLMPSQTRSLQSLHSSLCNSAIFSKFLSNQECCELHPVTP